MPAEDKRSSGQPFKAPPAATWNGMVDAGDAFRASQGNQAQSLDKVARSLGVLSVRNDSAAARRRGEILGAFTNPLTNLEAGSLRLAGIAPVANGHFGVYLKPCPAGDYADMQFAGACLALVNIIDADHGHAELVDGEFVLASSASGPIDIVFAPAGTGEKECVVRFGGSGGSRMVHFTLNAAMTTGTAAATFREMDGTLIGNDTLRDHTDELFWSLTSGTKGRAMLQGGEYWVVQAFCPVT